MRTLLLAIGLLCTTTAIAQHRPSAKVSGSLARMQQLGILTDSVDVVLSVNNNRFTSNFYKGARITSVYKPANVINIRVHKADLNKLLSDSAVQFADVWRQPKEELTSGSIDLAVNKVNTAHHYFSNANAQTIKASLKEQRFDTADVDLKGRIFTTGGEATTHSSHASVMATILGGGGNSSQQGKGVAPGVNLSSSNFFTLLPDADAVYKQHNITVQNHSYGTGIENYYGADALAYDVSTYNNPQLLHVFSAGNAGSSTSAAGNYAGLAHTANITGSFKMAKNIITVGATDSFNHVLPLSSRGPAYDGRIKPEIVAFGQDGTSGAAAIVSGSVAVLQHAYQTIYKQLPSAALVKAIVLNSADDIENKNPDYASGYGSLNLYNALQNVHNKQFFESNIKKGETSFFSIDVPQNTAQLKVMLVWMDTAAAANAAKALINDLDAVLYYSQTGQKWLPWVLNPTADSMALLQPAVRKKDTLNTAEQITVNNPAPGKYVLEVKAATLQTAKQPFAIAYRLDSSQNFLLTYPTPTDVLEAGTTAIVRWQTNIAQSAVLEYAINNQPWKVAASGIATQNGYVKWQVPHVTGTVTLRLVIPSINFTHQTKPLVISPTTQLQVGFNCTDSFLLYWNGATAKQYQLYQLGEKYLEPVLTTADSFSILKKASFSNTFYAVAPKIGNNTGLKSYLINYTTQGVACYFQNFSAVLQNEKEAFVEAQLGSLLHVKQIQFQKFDGRNFTSVKTITNNITSTHHFTDTALYTGINSYRTAITLAGGGVIYSGIEKVYYFKADPVIVYPNPIKAHQPIQFIVKEPGNYTIAIFDASGKKIYTQVLNNMQQQIKTSALAQGMYFVQINSTNGKSFTKKIVIQ